MSDSTSTTSGVSGGIAATPTAVKAAYDLANTANSTASTASTNASSALTKANAAMPKSGGTFTGNVAASTSSSVSSAYVRNIVFGTSSSSATVYAGTLLGVWE